MFSSFCMCFAFTVNEPAALSCMLCKCLCCCPAVAVPIPLLPALYYVGWAPGYPPIHTVKLDRRMTGWMCMFFLVNQVIFGIVSITLHHKWKLTQKSAIILTSIVQFTILCCIFVTPLCSQN